MAPQWLHELMVGLDPLGFWLLLAALATGAPFLLYRGTQAFWRLRTITDSPTAHIQSASQGYVALSGWARPHLAPVKAPLSGRSCLWYRYRVDDVKAGRDGPGRPVESGESSAPFQLDDGSGQCIVDPVGAFVQLREPDIWKGSYRNPLGGEPARWYMRKDLYRYVEHRIHDGDPLYCLGRLETPLRGAAERDQLQRALLRVWKQDPTRMARFDQDGDGTISPQEWERARTLAGTLAERAELHRSGTPILARLTATGDERQPFVICTFAEEDLATSLRWQTLGFTAAFVAVAVAAILSVLARFGGP